MEGGQFLFPASAYPTVMRRCVLRLLLQLLAFNSVSGYGVVGEGEHTDTSSARASSTRHGEPSASLTAHGW